MELIICKQLWGHIGTFEDLIDGVTGAGFHGVEGAPPEAPAAREELAGRIADAGLHYIAEISTGIYTPGKWVPDPGTTVEQHLETFRDILATCLEMQPLRITSMAGNDLWSTDESIRFFQEAMLIAADAETEVAFETHRGRSTMHPLATAEIIEAIPEISLTCDFSHWCVTTERSEILDELPELLSACAARARHVHARVGYDQGAQVPDPRAPEYDHCLAAHERWWDTIWEAQEARGLEIASMTPEFGPDGYLQMEPFTQKPVADIWDINRWMGRRQLERFSMRPTSAVEVP
ncbi:MAG: TIM barrel protein [Verrucomicrobiota bacterium]